MSSTPNKSNALQDLRIKLFNSRFFTISVIFHLVLVIIFGGTVIMTRTSEPTDFTGGEEGSKFTADETTPVKIPEVPQDQPVLDQTTPQDNTTPAIVANTAAAPQFVMPQVAMVAPAAIDPGKVAAAPKIVNLNPQQLSPAQLKKIEDFSKDWAKPAKKGFGGPGSDPKVREFEFVAYLAKYGDPNDKARGGDWASTNVVRNGKIVKGSLPNLLYFMNRLSKGKIKANPVAEPLDLSSEDIYIKKPPFIFFTGHRDFVLTDKEVANLQKYVQVGGCIWGDSSLPGRRSRFDLAFRREMRRVIPDEDKDWEMLPADYPMFKKLLYYKEITAPQPGVNHYKEPVYTLRFGGQVAIIYTANDYGDMWRLALTDSPAPGQPVWEKLAVDTTRVPLSNEFVYTDNTIFERMEIYYRGMEIQKVINSYKFGTNVVVHLLTRWEDQIKAAPTGL